MLRWKYLYLVSVNDNGKVVRNRVLRTGGLKVFVVAFHFGVNAISSVIAMPGIFDFAVSTVYTEGSD